MNHQNYVKMIDEYEANLDEPDRAAHEANKKLISTNAEGLLTAAALMLHTSRMVAGVCTCRTCGQRIAGLTFGATALITEICIATRQPGPELLKEVEQRIELLTAPVTM